MIRPALRRLGLLFATAALFGGCATKTEKSSNSSSAERYGANSGTLYQASENAHSQLNPGPAVADYSGATLTVDSAVAAGNGSASYDAPAIYAESAIMIDAKSGRVIFAKNADWQRPVASTQKLVSALLILDRGNLSKEVVIQPEDTQMEPTKLGIKAGEHYPREVLLCAMMVKSCNDCAAALARDHSGSTYAFAGAMTQKAYSLGATHSRFHNPHGLPEPGQYSTARDLARVAYEAYRSPTLRRYMRTRYYRVALQSGKVRTLEATNKLLSRSTMFNGMKTGYTAASGRCLVSSAASGGREVILVQLGSKTSYIFDDAERMMRWGLRPGFRPTFASLN